MRCGIGPRIRHFREFRSLSQIELGALIGVSNSRISNCEQGINRPDADVLGLLCRALNVSADEILETHTQSVSLLSAEKRHIENLRALNAEGQEKVLEYADDLLYSGKYIKRDMVRDLQKA